jgi:hypothetical protein
MLAKQCRVTFQQEAESSYQQIVAVGAEPTACTVAANYAAW